LPRNATRAASRPKRTSWASPVSAARSPACQRAATRAGWSCPRRSARSRARARARARGRASRTSGSPEEQPRRLSAGD
jgi:hypothetical protein